VPLFGAEETFFDVFQRAVLFAKADKQPEYVRVELDCSGRGDV
jgi:hypothetical protein